MKILNDGHEFVDMSEFKNAYKTFHLDIFNLLDLIVGNY